MTQRTDTMQPVKMSIRNNVPGISCSLKSCASPLPNQPLMPSPGASVSAILRSAARKSKCPKSNTHTKIFESFGNQRPLFPFMAGVSIVLLGSIFCLSGCRKQTTVRPGSLGNGYKGVAWGITPAEVVKALKISPVHDIGPNFRGELKFETDLEWRYYIFCGEQLCSVEVRRKVPRSDSFRPEVPKDMLQDLTKEYGQVEPTKGETLYKWNDGETVIQYDADNGAYKSGYRHGIGPEVCYKSISVWKVYLEQWRNFSDPADFNGCRELDSRPDPRITRRVNFLGNGYEGIRWGSTKEEVRKFMGGKSLRSFGNRLEEVYFETNETWVSCSFYDNQLYAASVIYKIPNKSSRVELTKTLLEELVELYGNGESVGPQYEWKDNRMAITFNPGNDEILTGSKPGPAVHYKARGFGPPPSAAQK